MIEIEFPCPRCGTTARVLSVQGDRCTDCHYEFKRFGVGERQTAADYFAVLTGEKYIVELPSGQGWIVAHG